MAFAQEVEPARGSTPQAAARRTEPAVAKRVPLDRAARGENFPVASLLLAPDVRRKVVTFYNYARAADNAADDPRLAPAARLATLDALEAGLDGTGGDPRGGVLRAAVGSGPALEAARALLAAFRRDASGIECRDWADLMAYCDASAVPVGRFLLTVHREGPEAEAPSDALCIALQVLNHLQDIADDRRELGRRYLPGDWMAAEGATDADLTARASTPALRRVLDRALDRCDGLLDDAAALPGHIRARGLRAQAAATVRLARRLAVLLREQDPLAARVALGRRDMVRASLAGLWSAR